MIWVILQRLAQSVRELEAERGLRVLAAEVLPPTPDGKIAIRFETEPPSTWAMAFRVSPPPLDPLRFA